MKAFMPPDNGINWWRDIPGYDGKYQANRIGDIRRTFKSGIVRDMTPYRKKNKERRRRLFVKLTHNGKTKEVPVLQIMAKTWYGEYNKNLIPYHKNGIVTDNRLDNIGFSGKSELGKMTGHMSGKKETRNKNIEGRGRNRNISFSEAGSKRKQYELPDGT